MPQYIAMILLPSLELIFKLNYYFMPEVHFVVFSPVYFLLLILTKMNVYIWISLLQQGIIYFKATNIFYCSK